MSPAGSGAGTGKGAQRRAALLDTAEELLVTAGSAELSMRAVAAAAGVRLGHLQYYFPSRADLVAAVLERVLTRTEQRLAPLLAPAPDGGGGDDGPGGGSGGGGDGGPGGGSGRGPGGEEAGPDPAVADARLVRALLADQDDPRLVRLFAEVWALAAGEESVAAVVRAFYRDYRDRVAAFVAARSPGLTPEECRARAQVFLMLVEGASLFRSGLAGERDPAADEELVRTARALLAG